MVKKIVFRRRRPRAARVWRLLLLHPVRLVKILLAEHASPRSLGAAAAFGAFVGTLAVPGVHTLLVYAGARQFKLNRVMALGANQLGIPPVVPALCIEIGYYLRHGDWLTEVSLRTLGREALQRYWEWTIGSLIVGPALAVAAGAAVWLLAALVQGQPSPAAAAREIAGTPARGDGNATPTDRGGAAAAGEGSGAESRSTGERNSAQQ